MARELPSEDQPRRQPTHEEIAQRAYQVFVERGCPQGHDLDHWLEAEAQLKNQLREQQAPVTAQKTTKTSSRPVASRRA